MAQEVEYLTKEVEVEEEVENVSLDDTSVTSWVIDPLSFFRNMI